MRGSRLGVLAIGLGLALAGLACGGGEARRPGTWVPPRAERSVARLPRAQRAAGAALVRLERAARVGDTKELCSAVYRFDTRIPIPLTECMRGLRNEFAPEGFSVEVREIRFSGPDEAIATASTVQTDVERNRQRSPNTTFRLQRRGSRWYVIFAT